MLVVHGQFGVGREVDDSAMPLQDETNSTEDDKDILVDTIVYTLLVLTCHCRGLMLVKRTMVLVEVSSWMVKWSFNGPPHTTNTPEHTRTPTHNTQHTTHNTQHPHHHTTTPPTHHNNNNTIWRGSVLTGEEPPPHSGEEAHALSEVGGPTQPPAIPPHIVKTPHLHGAPTTEETSFVKP